MEQYCADPLNTGAAQPAVPSAAPVGWRLVFAMHREAWPQAPALELSQALSCSAPSVANPTPNPIPPAVGNLPARTGNEVLKAMRWLRARWPDFTLPIYMHHGADDK